MLNRYFELFRQSPDGKLWGTITEQFWGFIPVGGLQQGVVNPTTVASTAAMPAPKAAITTVSATVAITTIDLPWPGFTGTIYYIPTAAFTTTTAGTAGTPNALSFPIGLASTGVIGKVLGMTFDGAKWWPSY